MAVPKSVTKVSKTKNGSSVTFTSNVDRVNYTLEELVRAALRDTGKVLMPKIREATPVFTGLLRKSWQKWVRKDRGDGHIELDLGVYTAAQAKKKNQKYAHHAHLILLGHETKNGGFVEGNNFLYQTIADNINLIRETQGQYLSAIEDGNKALRLAEAEADKAEDDD